MASQATNGPTGPVPSMVTTDVVIVSVVFSVLSLLSVILRFKARRNGKLQFQADDWIISITWVRCDTFPKWKIESTKSFRAVFESRRQH